MPTPDTNNVDTNGISGKRKAGKDAQLNGKAKKQKTDTNSKVNVKNTNSKNGKKKGKNAVKLLGILTSKDRENTALDNVDNEVSPAKDKPESEEDTSNEFAKSPQENRGRGLGRGHRGDNRGGFRGRGRGGNDFKSDFGGQNFNRNRGGRGFHSPSRGRDGFRGGRGFFHGR